MIGEIVVGLRARHFVEDLETDRVEKTAIDLLFQDQAHPQWQTRDLPLLVLHDLCAIHRALWKRPQLFRRRHYQVHPARKQAI